MPNPTRVTPELIAAIKQMLKEHLQVSQLSVRHLVGDIDLNFLVEGSEKWILKMTQDLDERPYREAIAQVQIALNENAPLEGKVPLPIPNRHGELIWEYKMGDSGVFICSLLTWFEGDFWAKVDTKNAHLSSLGHLLGSMDAELAKLTAPVLQGRQLKWDLQRIGIEVAPFVKHILRPDRRRLVQYFLMNVQQEALPMLQTLPQQVIHNDGNDWNILCNDESVTGLIDFGDAVVAPAIQEVAVALAYAMMDAPNPLERAQHFLKAFHAQHPLSPEAIEILYWLIAGRLCTTVVWANHAKVTGKVDDYALISEEQAWRLLETWHRINPIGATNSFRRAVDLPSLDQIPDAKLQENRKSLLSPALSLSYAPPIQMTRGALQYMFSADGRTYLDCVNNIPHVGHNHPRVVAAIQAQARRLNTNSRYLYPLLNNYAEQLLAKFPPQLQRVFLVNSGSAATDLALRIARTVTRRRELMVLEHGYHGNTMASIDVSHYKYMGKGGPGTPKGIFEVPVPDLLRQMQASRLDFPSEFLPAAFIHETIVGCGGQLVLPPGFLNQIYAWVRDKGGLCIADEVQTGFGRVGNHFWAFEEQGLNPDIVVLGKPIANGHPMGAVVTTAAIAEEFANGMEFFSSFGGNPVSCAAAQAVLEVIEEEQLQENALQTGNLLKKEWMDLAAQYPQIADVRGSGLFLGMEIVRDDGRFSPDKQLARQLVAQMKEKGFLLSTDGPFYNVIKFKPPMCFSASNAHEFCSAFSGTLQELIST